MQVILALADGSRQTGHVAGVDLDSNVKASVTSHSNHQEQTGLSIHSMSAFGSVL